MYMRLCNMIAALLMKPSYECDPRDVREGLQPFQKRDPMQNRHGFAC